MKKSVESDPAGSTLRLGFLLAALVFAMAAASQAFGAEGRWNLAIGRTTAAPQAAVELPVVLTTNGASVSAIAFSVEFDSTRLALDADPTLGSKVEIPAPTMFTSSSWVGSEAGAIGVVVYDRTRPIGTLSDGTISKIRFRVLPDATGFAMVRVSTTKPFSASGPRGEALEGDLATPGGIDIAAPTSLSPRDVAEAPRGVDRRRPAERGRASDLAVVLPLPLGVQERPRSRASLVLHNRGGETLAARLTLLGDGFPAAGPIEVSVPPGATRTWNDPAANLFGLPSASGALLVERPTADLLAAVSLESGAVPRIVRAADASEGDLRMVAVEDSSSRESTVTIANLRDEDSRFVMEVRDGEGALLLSGEIEVGARSARDFPLRAGESPVGNGLTILIRPLSDDARYAGWVTTMAPEGAVIQIAR